MKHGPPSRELGVWPITLHNKHVLVHFQKGFGIKGILRNDSGGNRSVSCPLMFFGTSGAKSSDSTTRVNTRKKKPQMGLDIPVSSGTEISPNRGLKLCQCTVCSDIIEPVCRWNDDRGKQEVVQEKHCGILCYLHTSPKALA
jgi:hypothetical protein